MPRCHPLAPLLALALGLLAALPAAAQDPYDDDPPYDDEPGQEADAGEITPMPEASFGKAPLRLVYDHVSGDVSLLDQRGETRETWSRADGAPYAEIPADRPVVVEVRNANPLVYRYDVQAIVSQVREPAPTCGGQGRSFALASALLAGGSLTTGVIPELPSGGLGDELQIGDADILALLSGRRAGGGLSDGELRDVGREAVQAVRRLSAAAAQMAEAEAEARDGLLRAARLGDAEPLGPVLKRLQGQLDAVQPGLSDPARVPVVIEGLVPDKARSLRPLLAAAEAIQQGLVEDPAGDAAADVLELAERAQAASDELAQASAGIQQVALSAERAREATRQRVALRPSDDVRQVAIQVLPLADGIEGVVPTRTRTGDAAVQAFLGPRRRRGFACSVGVALTFAPPAPEYGVRSLDGTLVDRAEEGLRTAPAVLFELAPPVLGRVLGGVVGIGLGQNLGPELYAGGSLRLFDPVRVTGGAMWRRVRALPSGLALGDTVQADDPDDPAFDPDFDLDTFLEDLPREWTPSFFLGLSITP